MGYFGGVEIPSFSYIFDIILLMKMLMKKIGYPSALFDDVRLGDVGVYRRHCPLGLPSADLHDDLRRYTEVIAKRAE